MAERGDLGRSESARVSAPPAPPLILESTSPQRRAILRQLGIPFDADATQLVLDHARGKAESVAKDAGDRPMLGVDTTVVLDGRTYGKPEDAGDAERMLEELSGRTHTVVSGLCLLTPGWETVAAAATLVTFRALTPRELGSYVAAGEWEGRAGGYAIQGLGATLVERIEGDYLNVVGLPAALLVRPPGRPLPWQRSPGVYFCAGASCRSRGGFSTSRTETARNQNHARSALAHFPRRSRGRGPGRLSGGRYLA